MLIGLSTSAMLKSINYHLLQLFLSSQASVVQEMECGRRFASAFQRIVVDTRDAGMSITVCTPHNGHVHIAACLGV